MLMFVEMRWLLIDFLIKHVKSQLRWSKTKYGPSTKGSEKQHVTTKLNDIERILK